MKRDLKEVPYDKKVTIVENLDAETPLSIHDDLIRVDWYDAGEGLFGDYNPENPNDIPLLRFDVYVMDPVLNGEMDDGWREVEDASYCTNMPTTTPKDILVKGLSYLFKEYRDVINHFPVDVSVKKLGESLSWISPDWFKTEAGK